MKKFLITFLSLILCLGVLAACGEKKEEIAKKAPVSQFKAQGFEKSTLKNQVSWEGINQFKTTTELAKLYETDKDAAIKEARKTVVDFFCYAKTATWIPADNWDFTHHDDGSGPDSMIAGQVYGGLPYVGLASSAIYRLMDFIDEETGVVDIYTAGGKDHEFQKMFGNQCANGAYQGYSRAINSANYGGTPRMVVSRGFIPVGDYTYPDYLNSWTEDYNTKAVCAENGDQTIYESYAKLQPGDGIVNFTTAGHVIMIAGEPNVVRTEDGAIDPNKSTIMVVDQAVQFVAYQHPDGGDQCQIAKNAAHESKFISLFGGGYLPFTFKEWLGEDPIEKPETKFAHEGDTFSLSKLYNTKITSNYHIYDIYAEIYDAAGNEVVKLMTHNDGASCYTLSFQRGGMQATIWGDPNKLDLSKEHTIKIYAQLGTGERPTLYEGKLVP